MLTERRQAQALADLIAGLETDIEYRHMNNDFQWLHDLIRSADEGHIHSELMRARLDPDNADIIDIIDQIVAAKPGYRQVHDSLAVLGPNLPEIKWLWRQWIPVGLISLLAASPGIGKTYIALDLCHRLTNGSTAPDGTPFETDRHNVIYVDAEDFLPAIYERSTAWGMNTSRFYPLQRPVRALIDLSQLDYQDHLIDMAHDLEPALIVVDSLSSISSKGENNVEDLRVVLGFLVELAREVNCGLVLVHHLRKPSRKMAGRPITMYDLRGSGHIVAMARSVLGVDMTIPHSNGPRTLKVLKTNLAPRPKSITVNFRPSPDNSNVASLVYGQGQGELIPEEAKTKIDTCANWLLTILDTPKAYSELKAIAQEDMGFNETIIQRARAKLNGLIIDTRGPKRPGNKWAIAQE